MGRAGFLGAILVALVLTRCGVPPAPGVGAPTAASPTIPPHDGRCTQPDLAAEEVLARLFLFAGQRDRRGLADCFTRAYLAATPDAAERWAAAGPVRKFAFRRLRAADDEARFETTAELLGGVGDWKGLASRQVTLRRDPDRWAVASID